MKRIFIILALFLFNASSFAEESIASLRGTHDLEGKSLKVKKKKVIIQDGGFERNYEQQPPLIPHSIDKSGHKYEITLKHNGCLSCHDKKHHKKENAPMVGKSHFIARDGTELDHVSTRRYFCNQCHVPQVNARPLVKNEFKSLD